MCLMNQGRKCDFNENTYKLMPHVQPKLTHHVPFCVHAIHVSNSHRVSRVSPPGVGYIRSFLWRYVQTKNARIQEYQGPRSKKKEDIIYSSTFSYDPVHNFYIILTRIFSRLTNFVIHVGFVLTGGASLYVSFVKIAFLSLITLN